MTTIFRLNCFNLFETKLNLKPMLNYPSKFTKTNYTAVALLVCSLCSLSLYSQSRKNVFAPRFQWLTLEQALLKTPDSVFHLKLSKNNTVNFPQNISQFKNLESLSLQGLKLSKVPEEIVQFRHLKFLDLSNNKIEVLPDTLCSLVLLETLILNRNEISSLPACLGYLSRLKAIDLYDTEVSNLPESLERVQTLMYVDFQGIQLRKEEIDALMKRFSWVKFFFDPPCNCFN